MLRAQGSIRSRWSFTTGLAPREAVPSCEEMFFEVRLEARNAFNQPVFDTPDTMVDDGSFGKSFNTSGNGPRELQLAAKLSISRQVWWRGQNCIDPRLRSG